MTAGTQPLRDIVVVGASKGGVIAVRRLLERVAPGFPGTILVVIHRSPYYGSSLVPALRADTTHRVQEATDGEPMSSGVVYVAPRDRHLLVDAEAVRVVHGPREHFSRPSIDPLFRSAAEVYGRRVVGVLLTGGGHDGTNGLIAIKAAGGVALVQDPREAESPAMPQQAVAHASPDAVLGLDEIAHAITALMNGGSR